MRDAREPVFQKRCIHLDNIPIEDHKARVAVILDQTEVNHARRVVLLAVFHRAINDREDRVKDRGDVERTSIVEEVLKEEERRT